MAMSMPSADIVRAAMPSACDAWVVAFSGGPDSTALLHLAWQSGWPTRAVHIHHGLQALADEWVQHCQAICQGWGIELTVVYVSPQAGGGGVEANARALRYAALGDNVMPHECVITAHHADDQAETLLLRMLRGTGPKGLVGVQPQRRFNVGWLARPLLGFKRAALQAYNQTHVLSSVVDPTNATGVAARSYLRQQVMPALEARWPELSQSLGQLARLSAENQTVLDTLLDERLALICADSTGPLSVSALAQQPQAMQHALIRRWLDQASMRPPNARRLNSGLEDLLNAGADRHPQLSWSEGCIARHGRWLFRLPAQWPITPEPVVLTPAREVTWGELGQVSWLADAPVGMSLRLRTAQPGDRMRWSGRAQRAVKEILREARIPPWWRSRVALVEADNGELLGIAGIGLSAAGQARLGDAQRLTWQLFVPTDGPDWAYLQAPA